MSLFAEANVIHVSWEGVAGAGGLIASGLVQVARIIRGYLEKRDADEAKRDAEALARHQEDRERHQLEREETRRQNERIEANTRELRAENIALFKDVATLQRQTAESLAGVKSEINRALEKLKDETADHVPLPPQPPKPRPPGRRPTPPPNPDDPDSAR